MTFHSERLHYLVRRYTEKTCSREEMQELFDHIAGLENREPLQMIIDQQYSDLTAVTDTTDIDWEAMYAHINRQKAQQQQNKLSVPRRRRWLTAAAAIILLLGAATVYLLLNKPQDTVAENNKTDQPAADITPGGDKAVLVLADGTRVALEDAGNTSFTEKNGVRIKNANGQVVYNTGAVKNAEVVYNTVYVPRKGQYRLVLSDGSKVWLNAESSIRYPVAFTGNERHVEITGEAYFEIEKNPNKPFKVTILPSTGGAVGGRARIEVLGTHFNINAYDNEGILKTTLLEGKVKVSMPENSKQQTANSKLLVPGQQAQITNTPTGGDGSISVINNADLEEAVAWKNGLFKFRSTNIQAIMRQVERWYDVEVVFEGKAKDETFSGTVPRSESVSEVLKLLELTHTLHFRIEGRKIVVSSEG